MLPIWVEIPLLFVLMVVFFFAATFIPDILDYLHKITRR